MAEPTTGVGQATLARLAVHFSSPTAPGYVAAAAGIAEAEAEARQQGARQERERLRQEWGESLHIHMHAGTDTGEILDLVDALLSSPPAAPSER